MDRLKSIKIRPKQFQEKRNTLHLIMKGHGQKIWDFKQVLQTVYFQ